MSYTKEFSNQKDLSTSNLTAGVVGFISATTRPAVVSVASLEQVPGLVTNLKVGDRDRLYALTDIYANCLDDSSSVGACIAADIQEMYNFHKFEGDTSGAFGKVSAFEINPLDVALCNLKGIFADLQRKSVISQVTSYAEYKRNAADFIEQEAQRARLYVAKAIGNGRDMASLSPAEQQAVQAFNHTRRMTQKLFNLPLENGFVYVDNALRPTQTLDDPDNPIMNKAFAGFSYGGANRETYLAVMPAFVLTSHPATFIHALSKPTHLKPNTTRPGPLNVPAAIGARYNIPTGVQLTQHSIPRFGETNQTDHILSNKKQAPPIKYYYTYEADGITKVVAMKRIDHEFLQMQNRVPMKFPAGVVANIPEGAPCIYVKATASSDRIHTYRYSVNGAAYELSKAQHQAVMRYNLNLVDKENPNAPLQYTNQTDGDLYGAMNSIFNDLTARSVSHKSTYFKVLIPTEYKDRLALMELLHSKIKPAFDREQERIRELREGMLIKLITKETTQDQILDTCRKEAVNGFRKMLAELTYARSMDIGSARKKINEVAVNVQGQLDKKFSEVAGDYAALGAARIYYHKKTEPFYGLMRKMLGVGEPAEKGKKVSGFIDVSKILEGVSLAEKNMFVGTQTKVSEALLSEGGLKEQLEATYWGSVTQHISDAFYGPEGVISSGKYITREGLPKNRKEFEAYLVNNMPDVLKFPLQVGNRLTKNFASFAHNMAPYYSMPWPNLHRVNDVMREAKPNTAQSPDSIKPIEPPVKMEIKVALQDGTVVTVPMTGTRERENKNVFKRRVANPNQSATAQMEGVVADDSMSLIN